MVYRLDITLRLHRRMLDIVAAGLPLITRSIKDADLVGLAYLREEMVEVLATYRRHVAQLHSEATDRLAPEGIRQVRTLVDSCADLDAAYDLFRSRWLHRDGIAHWHEYRLSAVVLMKRIRSLVQMAEVIRTDVATAGRSTAFADGL